LKVKYKTINACNKEETSIQLECVNETDTIKNKNSRGDTRAPIDAKWQKQAREALTVWLLTYITGVVILKIINAEHVFVLAILPTLSTIFYNRGIFKRLLIRAGANLVKIARLR